MIRDKKASSLINKVDIIDRYLFVSSDAIYEVKNTSDGLFAKREVQDNLLFAGGIIQRDWFKITKEYIDSLIEFNLAKKI